VPAKPKEQSAFASAMAEFDEEFEQAQEQATDYNELADGPHQAIITLCKVEQYEDRWVFRIKFENPNGQVSKWNGLDNEIGRDIAAKDAKRLGYTGKLSGLEEWCESEAAINLVCDIKVVTNPGNERDFKNVYINRVLGPGNPEDFKRHAGPGEPGEGGFGGAAADDDIPF
jgi:hypothetical protein